MSRDARATVLAAIAYIAAVASLLLIETGSWWLWIGSLALWAAALAGSIVAAWRRGLWALPSAIFALSFPVGAAIAFGGGGLS
jgi:hypothetical protein